MGNLDAFALDLHQFGRSLTGGGTTHPQKKAKKK
jgi:hypothetical protein